jgi:hypothetical protein
MQIISWGWPFIVIHYCIMITYRMGDHQCDQMYSHSLPILCSMGKNRPVSCTVTKLYILCSLRKRIIWVTTVHIHRALLSVCGYSKLHCCVHRRRALFNALRSNERGNSLCSHQWMYKRGQNSKDVTSVLKIKMITHAACSVSPLRNKQNLPNVS